MQTPFLNNNKKSMYFRVEEYLNTHVLEISKNSTHVKYVICKQSHIIKTSDYICNTGEKNIHYMPKGFKLSC